MASSTRLLTLQPARFFSAGARDPAAGAWIHSDTLMAALCSTAMETGVLAEVFQDGAPPFLVSSVFIEIGGVRLYPRPLGPPPGPLPEGPENSPERQDFLRAWKSTAWISEGRLEALCEGRRVRYQPAEAPVWCLESERATVDPLPRTFLQAGNRVDRLGGGADLLKLSLIALPEGARLFFLTRLADESMRPDFDELVTLLGQAGLGGRRSSGKGQFELAWSRPAPGFLEVEGERGQAFPEERSEGPSRRGSGRWVLLSLYLPSRAEVERGVIEGAAAETLWRVGWIHSNGGPQACRKRPVRMLKEGTLLSGLPGDISGEVRNVAPPSFTRHPVWRDGRAFLVHCPGAAAPAAKEEP
ncbi:MAG: hypothetical protein HY717_21860 [Planctomycetes bacterium]|nr:hypothetical protein [Planctomycetota bacterium]